MRPRTATRSREPQHEASCWRSLHISLAAEPLLELCQPRFEPFDGAALLLDLVQQHRGKELVHHGLDLAVRSARDEARVDLLHFFRNEAVLQRAARGILV